MSYQITENKIIDLVSELFNKGMIRSDAIEITDDITLIINSLLDEPVMTHSDTIVLVNGVKTVIPIGTKLYKLKDIA